MINPILGTRPMTITALQTHSKTATQQWMLTAAWGILLICLFWPTSWDIVSIWRSSPSYTHSFYVLPISLAILFYQLRKAPLPALAPNLNLVWPVAIGAALWVGGVLLSINLLQHAGLVAMLVAGIRAMLGHKIFQRHLFAFCFLGFMVPFGDEIVPLLQTFTADFIVFALNLLNIPVLDDGIYLTTPAGLFLVEEACAGLRFLLATIMVGTLFAWISFVSLKRRLIFIGLCFIIPIFANALRATGIVLIATWTDKEHAAGVDHLVYGWGFFAVILLLLIGLGSRYADREIESLRPLPVVSDENEALPAKSGLIVFASILLVAIVARLIGEFV